MTQVDEDFLADVFANLVDEILDGGTPDIDRLIEERDDLRGRIEEIHELAHRIAGRQQPARPKFAGYDILRELGRGGMGTVFLARQRDLGRNVALKVLPPGITASARTARRLLDEARTLARLSDDRIVRIHNVIEHAETLAYAMEWIDGCSLRDVIDRLRRSRHAPTMVDVANALRAGEAAWHSGSYLQYIVRIGIAMARALGVVHHSGIVHRDVKPSNILIRRDGHALLADFGLAYVADSSLTATGAFLGTTYYASPEQLRAADTDELDSRSDVYSLAATLFEAITLRPRFVGRSAVDVLRTIEDEEPPSLRKLAPDAPRDLDTILRKAMEPDPDERYQSADEFADDLERLLLLQPIHARPAGLLKRGTKLVRRQRRLVAATIFGAAVVGVAWFAISRQLRESETRQQRAGEHVAAARSELLASAGRLWRESARERSAGGIGGPEPLAGGRPLRAALDHYDRAADLVPDDVDIAIERAVVALATHLGHASPDELLAEIDAWPSQPRLTVEFAEGLGRGRPRPLTHVGQDVLAATTPRDRRTLGLLAFLIGNVPVCEHAWESIESVNADYPLANAALALLHEADGDSTGAYAHLTQAVRDFPKAPQLMLGLADIAVDLGDADLAELWLERALRTDAEFDTSRTTRLRAEIDWLRGDAAAARAALERLVETDTETEESRFRLAQMDLAVGDSTAALAHLTEIVRRRPHTARFRRQLAEVALRAGDVPLYLQQARYVVSELFARDRSDHSIDEHLDILRFGGMTALYRGALEVIGRRPSLDRASIVHESWPVTPPRLSRQRAELALVRAANFDATSGLLPVRAAFSGLHRGVTATVSVACRSWLVSPRLRWLVRPVWRLPIDACVTVTVAHWRTVVDELAWAVRHLEARAADGEIGWESIGAAPSPPPHSDHVLVADRSGLVLFGGIGPAFVPRAETWRWDGREWRELPLTLRPQARLRHAAAFDPERGRIVMFGGSRTKRGDLFDDTWEFDGSTWQQVDTNVAPSPRNDHAMAWDPNTRRILLFGGRDDAGDRDDTWAFDGSDWVELSPTTRPPARRDHNLVTDASRDRLVLFGGLTTTGRFPTVVWEWDGGDWRRIGARGDGPLRAGAGMAYDPTRRRTIMFGGMHGIAHAGTFEWDGQTWRRSKVLFWPSGRSGHAMAFDPISQGMVLFGGYGNDFLSDTWVRSGAR